MQVMALCSCGPIGRGSSDISTRCLRQSCSPIVIRRRFCNTSKWFTLHELEALRNALARGGLAPDFLGKLKQMTAGDLSHHFIEQNCRLLAALLLAKEDGRFREGTRWSANASCEWSLTCARMTTRSPNTSRGPCGRSAGNARRYC